MSESMRPEQSVAASAEEASRKARRENWPAGVAGAGAKGRVVTYHYPPEQSEDS